MNWYTKYKDNKTSIGHLLYCLQEKGVPISIAEILMFDLKGNVSYLESPFCTYYFEDDEPIFSFSEEFKSYGTS